MDYGSGVASLKQTDSLECDGMLVETVFGRTNPVPEKAVMEGTLTGQTHDSKGHTFASQILTNPEFVSSFCCLQVAR